MSDKNDVKLEGKKFTSDYQPSPEAKRKGWERRKFAQDLMDKVAEYAMMTEGDFDKVDQKKLSMRDKMAFLYVSQSAYEPKMLMHMIDKHIPTPQKLDITSKGKKITSATVKIIRPNHDKNGDKFGAGGDEASGGDSE